MLVPEKNNNKINFNEFLGILRKSIDRYRILSGSLTT